MKTARMTLGLIVLSLLILTVAAVAQNPDRPGRGCGLGQGVCWQATLDGPMDSSELISGKLDAAIEDEYHAYSFYAAVVAEYGEVRPFSRIMNSELRHIEALTRLYEKYGLTAPENPYADTSFEFASLDEAAQMAYDVEVANASFYTSLLEDVNDPDVIMIFENLQFASNEHHLPAFERYIENGGECPYGAGCGQGRGRGRGCGNGRGCGGCR